MTFAAVPELERKHETSMKEDTDSNDSGPDRLADLKGRSDQTRIDFLRTELVTGFTLASVAETERQIGDETAAARCLELAEKAYSTLARFLSDPLHAKHIADAEHRELTTGMDRLRAGLDGVLCRCATTKSKRKRAKARMTPLRYYTS